MGHITALKKKQQLGRITEMVYTEEKKRAKYEETGVRQK